jgi:nickel-type superoxide dismutase maturation protease
VPYGFQVPRRLTITRPPLAIALVLVGAVWWLRGRVRHVAVSGSSMLPTLAPGDRLVLLRTTARPRVGQLALAFDPREPTRELLKRVHAVADGMVELRGDNPSASTDSRQFGRVPAADVVAGPAWRYAPSGRTGWVRASVGEPAGGDGRLSAPRARAGRRAGRRPGRR